MSKVYRMPCGIETYNKNRQRHNWIVVRPDTGERYELGEDYIVGCEIARAWSTLGFCARLYFTLW